MDDQSEFDDPNHFYPDSKGDATWDGLRLTTADGHVINGGPIGRQWYSSIKGIDLVKYFTENHLRQKVKAEIEGEQIHKTRNPHRDRWRRSIFQWLKNIEHNRIHFLYDLPAEIRSEIYSYVVANGTVNIVGGRPRQQSIFTTSWPPPPEPVTQPHYRLSCVLNCHDIIDGLRLSPALLLTCKKMYEEAKFIYYSQLRFCFDSRSIMNRFLDLAYKDGIKAITRIYIYHSGDGERKCGNDAERRARYLARWRNVCRRFGEAMPALKSLSLEIAIDEWPVTLGPQDQWWQTLLELIPNGPIEDVEVVLSHRRVRRNRMARAAQSLEDAMMSAKGKLIRQEREANLAIRRCNAAEAARLEQLKNLPTA